MPYRSVMPILAATVAAAMAVAVLIAPPTQAQPTLPEGPGGEPPTLPMPPALDEAPPMPDLDESDLVEEGLGDFGLPDETMAREAQLDELFRQLSEEENPAWPVIQAQIWRVWRRSGSPSMDLLLRRAMEKMEAEDYAAAIRFLDDLVRLAPEFAEGWNQRATAYFLAGDYGRSMRDIEATLALEPRHFGALAGLGIILDRTGNKAGAVAAYRRALELHPNLEGAQRGVDRLSEDVDGTEL